MMRKINVVITVDTEHSIGGALRNPRLRPVGNELTIWGKCGDQFLGIPRIIDIAESCRIRVSFFVEVLNAYYFGDHEVRKVCEYILERGHDIQLHLHPNYLSFRFCNPTQNVHSDIIGTYTRDRQIELLTEGMEILRKADAPNPVAFRAGCFGANRDTLKAMKAVGLLIDSSYNKAYLGGPCLLEDVNINDVSNIEGVWEVPITNFVEATGLRAQRYRPLDLNGVSYDEMLSVLAEARFSGPYVITIILHSFSFVKPYDVQYSKVRPRWRVIERFERLCGYLNDNRDYFTTTTLGELGCDDLKSMCQSSVHRFAVVAARLSWIRGIEQLRDNLY